MVILRKDILKLKPAMNRSQRIKNS